MFWLIFLFRRQTIVAVPPLPCSWIRIPEYPPKINIRRWIKAACSGLPMQRAGQSVREMSRAQACRRRRRRPTRPAARAVVPQGRQTERSATSGERSEIEELQGAWVGVDPRGTSGDDARHARLDERGVWPDRSVLKQFLSGKTVRWDMASPSQAGSPGSRQGLDARWLEKLYGVNEQVSEQVREQDIPGYMSRIDLCKSSIMNSA